MSDLQLEWLIPTLVQVLGLAIIFSVFGLSFDTAGREKKPLLSVISGASPMKGLAFGAVVLAAGVGFSDTSWLAKAAALALAGLLLVEALGVKKRLEQRPRISSKILLLTIGKVCLGILLLLFVVWGVHLGWHVVHLYGIANNLKSNLSQFQVQDIAPLVKDAADDMDAVQADLRPLFPVFNALQGLPVIGKYMDQLDPLLTYADDLAQAGEAIVAGLEPLLENQTASLSLPERAVQVLKAGQEYFTAAARSLDQAKSVRPSIRAELLPGSMRSIFTMLDEKFNLLVAGNELLQAAPTFLGSDQPQNYLVLAQNRDELRATGGFISGIGLVTLKAGTLESFSLGDSYAIDDYTKAYPAPPAALKRFMLADYWVARDANWSPDFPTSAQQAQALYTLSTGIETQGVIAFNQLAVRKVLEVTGPVQVPGTDTPISADNVEEYMRQAWTPEPAQGLSPEWWLHRKDFMMQLGNVIIEKVLEAGDGPQLLNLAKSTLSMLEQGQLLLYFNDQTAQDALEQAGWDKAIHESAGDYLYLVDSNVGFNKVDSVVTRSLTYRVDLREMTAPSGEVTMIYQNNATGNAACVQVASYGNGTYQDMQQRCYWDYWRLYSPGGVEFISSDAQPVPASELLNNEGWSGQVESMAGEGGKNVFAGLLVLPESQASSVDLSYHLPVTVLQSSAQSVFTYTLQVDVQPGLQGLPFRLVVLLPSTAQNISGTGGLQPGEAGSWSWQGILEKSISFSLRFTN